MISNVFKALAQINIDPNTLQIPKTEPTSNTVSTVLSLVFGILGAISFLVIVISGLKLSLSRGNSESIGKAKNTIIYAAVGLVISMLAFTIVRFVVGRV